MLDTYKMMLSNHFHSYQKKRMTAIWRQMRIHIDQKQIQIKTGFVIHQQISREYSTIPSPRRMITLSLVGLFCCSPKGPNARFGESGPLNGIVSRSSFFASELFSLLPAPIEVEPNVAVVADCRCRHTNFIPKDFQVLMCGNAGFT